MTTIIGVDGALANTGLAVWRDGLISVRTIHTPPGPPEPRWRYILSQLHPLLTDIDSPTLVVLEAVFVGAKVAGTALDLAMLHGCIRLAVALREIPLVVVDCQAVKQYACGIGRATPREMIAATSRLRLGFNIEDDHQADALFMVAMALHHYDAPMCDTFPAGHKAMARTKWPRFSLIEPGLVPVDFERDERATRRRPVTSPFMPALP